MIFAKIDPVLSIVKQDTLFNPTPEYSKAPYMTAVANEYALGSNKVNFRVMYGQCAFDGDKVVNFKTIHSDSVTLTGVDIETWGTDDSVILNAIAAQQGTTVVEIVYGEMNGGMF